MIIFDHNRGHSQGKVTKPSHHPRAKMHDICPRLFVKCNLQAQQRTGEKSVLLSNPKILQHLLPSLFPISLNACRSANHLLALHRPKHHLHVIVSQMDLCPSSTLNLASIVSTETAGEIADEIVGEIEDGTVDLCLHDPGYEVDLELRAPLKVMTAIWMGYCSLRAEMAEGRLEAHGPPALIRAMPAWLGLSSFAPLKREVA